MGDTPSEPAALFCLDTIAYGCYHICMASLLQPGTIVVEHHRTPVWSSAAIKTLLGGDFEVTPLAAPSGGYRYAALAVAGREPLNAVATLACLAPLRGPVLILPPWEEYRP